MQRAIQHVYEMEFDTVATVRATIASPQLREALRLVVKALPRQEWHTESSFSVRCDDLSDRLVEFWPDTPQADDPYFLLDRIVRQAQSAGADILRFEF